MSDNQYEQMVIKPPIELIPDEYEHFNETTASIAVHTFSSNREEDQKNVNLFIETLHLNGYEIHEENLHCLDGDDFDGILDNIYDGSKDLGGLILYFSGISEREGTIRVFNGQFTSNIPIQDVVIKFTSYTCPDLKNKPKIFIFDVKWHSSIQIDSISIKRFGYDLTYDTPAEADMLIVYNKTESSNPVTFIDRMCAGIRNHGKIEDVVSLITCLDAESIESRPLIISTLTRKFYFTVSEHRGHHYHIHQHHEKLKKDLEYINNKLLQVNSTKKKSSNYGHSSRTLSASSYSFSITKQKDVLNQTNTRGVSNKKAPVTQSDGDLLKKNLSELLIKKGNTRNSKNMATLPKTGAVNTDTRSFKNISAESVGDVIEDSVNNTTVKEIRKTPDTRPRWK